MMPDIMDLHPDRISPEPNSGCWLWTGSYYKETGYGEIIRNGRRTTAHKVSCELVNGPVPKGLCVRHKCDVRLCVNPDHLIIGTYSQNNLDLWRRGGRKPKLSQVVADQINADPTNREKGFIQRTADKYGVTRQAIRRVIIGQMYAAGRV